MKISASAWVKWAVKWFIAGVVLVAVLVPQANAVRRRGPSRRGSGRSSVKRQAPPRISAARVKSTRTKSASRTKGRARKARSRGPVVSAAQKELAQQMARDAYAIGSGLAPVQRAALLTRLLYTLRPDVMPADKKRWAEELFEVAQRIPAEAPASKPAAPGANATGALRANGPALRDAFQDSLRNEAIATAAARLAIYDSDRALDLLDKLPSERGRREDPRTMAARLVFPIYLRQHGAAGAQTLLAHAAEWGEHGGFPYAASAAALARLSGDQQAAENFFRQALSVFERGNEGAFGVAEFGELLERAAAMEAISEDAAEEAGGTIIAQASKLLRARNVDAAAAEPLQSATGADGRAGKGGELAPSGSGVPQGIEVNGPTSVEPRLSEEARRRLAAALNNVRLAAPKAYAHAVKEWPELAKLSAVHEVSPVQELKIDPGLQASFAELGTTIAEHRGPEALNEVIRSGLERVNAKYRAGACPACLVPDAQSSAFVSLAAYGSPWSIGPQVKAAIEEPFWRAYFLAIAAQQVGEPTRVADPTSRRPIQKEEAEPEDEEGGAE